MSKKVPTYKVATYKGKEYELGETKYGKKAKLKFLHGANEFWVDLNLIAKVKEVVDTSNLQDDDRCVECGKPTSTDCQRCGSPCCYNCSDSADGILCQTCCG